MFRWFLRAARTVVRVVVVSAAVSILATAVLQGLGLPIAGAIVIV